MSEPNVHLYIDENTKPVHRPYPHAPRSCMLAYAIELLLRVDKVEEGREIGFDYEQIRRKILRKFPVVTHNGPHKGKPSKMPLGMGQGSNGGSLWDIARCLNRAGVRLPVRPYKPYDAWQVEKKDERKDCPEDERPTPKGRGGNHPPKECANRASRKRATKQNVRKR